MVLFFFTILSKKRFYIIVLLCYYACVMGTVLVSVLQTPILSRCGGHFIVECIIYYFSRSRNSADGSVKFHLKQINLMFYTARRSFICSHVSVFIFPPSRNGFQCDSRTTYTTAAIVLNIIHYYIIQRSFVPRRDVFSVYCFFFCQHPKDTRRFTTSPSL